MNKAFWKILAKVLFLPCILSAWEMDQEKIVKHSHFEIGPEISYLKLHFKSTNTAHAFKVHGYPVGINAFYEYKEPKVIYLNVNCTFIGNHLFGKFNRHFREKRGEVRIGIPFSLGCRDQWKIIPYSGFGGGVIVQSNIRPNFNKVQAPTYYVPFGIIVGYVVHDNFQVGMNLKWMPQVDASIKNSAIKHSRFDIKNRDGLLVEFPLTYNYHTCIDGTVSFVPYWRYLRKGPGITPQNRQFPAQLYYFVGAKLMIGINF